MATYILLLHLTPEGQQKALVDPDYMLDVEDAIDVEGVSTLGLYAVLGPYDYVSLVQAPDNEAVAKFSIELGVKAGVHVTTLPVIPASRLAAQGGAMEAAVGVESEPEIPVREANPGASSVL